MALATIKPKASPYNVVWHASSDNLYHVGLLPLLELTYDGTLRRRLMPAKMMVADGITYVTVANSPYGGIVIDGGISRTCEPVLDLHATVPIGGNQIPRWFFDAEEIPLHTMHLIFLSPGNCSFIMSVPYANANGYGGFARPQFRRNASLMQGQDPVEYTTALYNAAQRDLAMAGYVSLGCPYPASMIFGGDVFAPVFHVKAVYNITIEYDTASGNTPPTIKSPNNPPLLVFHREATTDAAAPGIITVPGPFPYAKFTSDVMPGRIFPGLDAIYGVLFMDRMLTNVSLYNRVIGNVLSAAPALISSAMKVEDNIQVLYSDLTNLSAPPTLVPMDTLLADNLSLHQDALRAVDVASNMVSHSFISANDKQLFSRTNRPDIESYARVANSRVVAPSGLIHPFLMEPNSDDSTLAFDFVTHYDRRCYVFKPVIPWPVQVIYDGNHVMDPYTDIISEIYPAALGGPNFLPIS